MYLISSSTLASDTTTWTFDNLPQNYTNLKVVIKMEQTISDFSRFAIGNAGGMITNSINYGRFYGGYTTLSAQSYIEPMYNTNDTYGQAEIYIMNYSSKVGSKTAMLSFGGSFSATNSSHVHNFAQVNAAGAITKFIINSSWRTIRAGSTVDIYGMS